MKYCTDLSICTIFYSNENFVLWFNYYIQNMDSLFVDQYGIKRQDYTDSTFISKNL